MIGAALRLRRIVLDGGDIEAKAEVASLAVETRGDASREGQAAALTMPDRGGDPRCTGNCRNTLPVTKGSIGEFFGRTRDGSVELVDASQIGSVTLALGDEADFTLG